MCHTRGLSPRGVCGDCPRGVPNVHKSQMAEICIGGNCEQLRFVNNMVIGKRHFTKRQEWWGEPFSVGRAVPASRKAVGSRVPRDRYCTSTTTLKNRIAAFSAAVAPSTAFQSPSNIAAPFTTVRAPSAYFS